MQKSDDKIRMVEITFCIIGKIASLLDDDEAADARPFGKCESGTRIGLCRLMARFFCALPILQEDEKSGLSLSFLIPRDH